MPKYGIIENGKLVVGDTELEGFKPVVYAEIPNDFDQTTHYTKQSPPVENEDHIFVGIEIKELKVQDDVIEEPHVPEDNAPHVPKPTDDERLTMLEDAVLILMME